MQTRFNKNAKVFDIVITAVAAMFSVGMMLYGVFHFGLAEAWPELVLNLFYIACLLMICIIDILIASLYNHHVWACGLFCNGKEVTNINNTL